MANVNDGDRVASYIAWGMVSACVVSHLLHQCCSLARFSQHERSFSRLGTRLRACVSKLLGGNSNEKDFSNAQVQRLIDRERLKRLPVVVQPFMHVIFLVLCIVMALVGKNLMSETYPGMSRPAFMNLLDLVFCYMITKFLMVFPEYATSRVLSGLYVMFYAEQVTKCFLLADAEGLLLMQSLGSGMHIIIGFLVCDVRVTVPSNVLLCAAEAIMLYTRAPSHTELGNFFEGKTALLLHRASDTISAVVVLGMFEHLVWAIARHTLKQRASSKTDVTVSSLLSALCDAVVTLDPDLRISNRAVKLANLLQQGCRILEGSPFVGLMVENDQARFRSFLARAPETADSCNEPAPAQALNVSLRNTNGAGVQVQLFHSHFQDDNNQVSHLLGILEVGEASGRQASRVSCEAGADVSRASFEPPSGCGDSRDGDWESDAASFAGESASVICAQAHGGGLAGGQRSSSHGRAQGGEDTVAPLRGPAEEQPWRRLQQEECAVAFDALRFRLTHPETHAPVINANLLQMESLQQWVAEWSSTKAMLQDLVNAALRPVSAASWPGGAPPPHKVSFHVGFQGSCALPADILTRATASTGDTQQAPAGDAGAAPPLRVSIGRVMLVRSPTRSPAHLRGRRHHQHASVQPTLVGASASSNPMMAVPPTFVGVSTSFSNTSTNSHSRPSASSRQSARGTRRTPMAQDVVPAPERPLPAGQARL